MFTLDDPIKESFLFNKDEDNHAKKIKFAKVIPITNIKTLVDPNLKKQIEANIKEIETIIQRAEKEFEFAGFSVNDKCKNNLLKSVEEFDKTNQKYTPINIVELNKYHHSRLNYRVHIGVFNDADLNYFYSIIYKIAFDYLVEQYPYVDMVFSFVGEKYLVMTIFNFRTRFNPGSIIGAFVIASPNPLDIMSPVVIHQIKYDPSWFGTPK